MVRARGQSSWECPGAHMYLLVELEDHERTIEDYRAAGGS